jgi:hypothetical protein
VKAFTFGIVFESAFVVHTGLVRARIMPRENWSANQPEVLPLTGKLPCGMRDPVTAAMSIGVSPSSRRSEASAPGAASASAANFFWHV